MNADKPRMGVSMASDWIKMRTDLYRDPKVCAVADLLMHQQGELAAYVNQNCQRDMTVTRNVMRNVTVGALVSVWGVMRQRGKRIGDDLVLKSAAIWVIDDVSELPGFGSALAEVGWVVADQDGITFPNFFSEYNVDPNEDAKAKNAERQRRYREKQKAESNENSNVTVTSKSNVREEKRREEEIPPKSPKGDVPEGFARFWACWPKSDRKAAKSECLKAWLKADGEKHVSEILAHVERMKASQLWRKNGGEFIKAPLVYLNKRDWEGTGADEQQASAWWVPAGFANADEANNARCFEHNAHQFRDGARIPEAA